jgi:hypothetical protein
MEFDINDHRRKTFTLCSVAKAALSQGQSAREGIGLPATR